MHTPFGKKAPRHANGGARWKKRKREILSETRRSVNALVLRVSRAFNLSGFVARNLSGFHSHPKEVADETDRTVTGDTEDEI
jgi:hypothetical protein